MRKTLLLTLIAVIVLSLALTGCNTDNGGDNTTTTNSSDITTPTSDGTTTPTGEDNVITPDSSGVTTPITNDTTDPDEEYNKKASKGLEFMSNGDGTCYVSGLGTCTDTDIIIPKTSPEGDKVTEIGLLHNCKDITSVIIPDSVMRIGYYAFKDCTGLTSITIPDSVTSIGNFAFSGCTAVKDLHISSIEAWLKADILSHPFGSSRSTEKNLYINGRIVTEINIPNDFTSIGNDAFAGCTGLTSVTIPDSVTSIGKYAFYGCSAMKELHISSVEAWCKVDLRDYYSHPFYSSTATDQNIYINGEKITNLVIPETITSIGAHAFENCTGLTSITIPDSVTSIGDGAFYGCTGLTSIVIPDSVTSIGSKVFFYCTDLTSIEIPDSVKSIGDYAFYYCTGLTSIVIPDSVTSIGSSAFEDCTRLPINSSLSFLC